MVGLQFESSEIQHLINLLQQEVDKNPEGFIKIAINSYNEKTDAKLTKS